MSLRRALIEAVAPGAVGAVRSAVRLHVGLLGTVQRAAYRNPPVGVIGEPPSAAARRMWLAYALAAVGAGAAAALSDSLPAGLAALSLCIAAVALATRVAFNSWVGRGGRGGWWAFWRSPSQWSPPATNDGGSIASVAILLAAVVVLLPSAAVAEPNLVGQVVDIADKIIGLIFPSAGNGWTHALGVLSSVLAGCGGAMLTWHAVAGTVSTAHEGKVLGSRFHQIWAPVRVSLGMGLLLPVPGAGGLDAAQMALAGAATAASSVASTIWTGFVGEVLATGGPTASGGGSLGIPTPVGGAELARRILSGEACADARDMEDVIDPTTAVPKLPPFGGTQVGGSQVWDWGVGCGSVSISVPSASGDAAAIAYGKSRISAIQAEFVALRGVAKGLALANIPGGYGDAAPGPLTPVLSYAGSAYDSSMTSAAAAYLAVRDKDARASVADLAKKDGWPSAGALWASIGAASAAVTALASEAPGYTAPDPSQIYGWCPAEAPGHCQGAVTYVLADIKTTLAAEDRAAGGPTVGDLAAVGGGGDIMSRLTRPVTAPLQAALMRMATVDPKDPVGDLVSSGHVIVGASEAAIVGGGAVAALAHNWIADSVGAGGAWDWLSGWARLIIGATYAGAWTQAYMLPMLPMIHVLWLTIGWTIALVEGAIAAPILAFLLIRMDGQELIDSVQRPGFIVAVNICFRPVFGILGLIGSYYVLPIAVGLVGRYFPIAWMATQSTHTVTIGGLVGVYVLLSYLEYQVAARVLGLVSEVPDRILRWWGSPPENLHEREHAGGVAVIGGAVSGAIGRGPSASKIASGGGGGGGGSIAPAASGNGGGSDGASKVPDEGGASEAAGSRPMVDVTPGAQGALPSPSSTYTAGENPGVMIDGKATNVTGSSAAPSGGAASPWYAAGGGVSKLSPAQATTARAAYSKWSAGRSNAPSYGAYVSYAQSRHAERAGNTNG